MLQNCLCKSWSRSRNRSRSCNSDLRLHGAGAGAVRNNYGSATLVATVLGPNPASVGTEESEGRQMKQC